MAKRVVVAGEFSQAEVKISWKAPIVMAGFAALILVFFGVLGSTEQVAFQLSETGDRFKLADFIISSSLLSIILGVVLVAITAIAALLVRANRQVPTWLSLIYGLVAATALLGWLAAGAVVPVSFILGSAIVLAVPIILGAMGGVMSERVGVVNIAIEGQLLTGAFVASVVSSLTDNL